MTGTTFKIDRALRRAVRATIAESPQLTLDYQREKRARRLSIWEIFYYSLAVGIGGPLVFVMIPLVLIACVEDGRGADGVLAAAAVVSTAASLACAQLLVMRLRSGKAISVLSHLPARDSQIAGQIRLEPAAWSIVVLYFSVFAYGYLAWKNQFGPGGWSLVAGLAVGQWLTSLATGAILGVFLPRFPFGMTILVAAVVGVIYAQAGAPHIADVLFAQYFVLPAGWMNAVLGLAFLKNIQGAWCGAAVGTACIAGLFVAMRHLALSYTIREVHFPPDTEATATLAPPFHEARPGTGIRGFFRSSREAMAAVDEAQLTPEQAERQILTGAFLEPTVWSRFQWQERIVDRLLTDRERAILELLAANRPRWSESWWTLAFGGAILTLISGVLVAPVGKLTLVYFAAVCGSFLLFGGGRWRGFRTQDCAGALIPYFAVLPIGFDEISRLLLKVGLVRAACVFVLVLLFAVCGFRGQIVDPLVAVIVCAAFASLLVILQGWIIIFYLSLGMRFPDVRLRTLAWHAAPIVLIVVSTFIGFPMLVAGFALPAGAGVSFAAAGLLVLALCSWGGWQLLRTMYLRGLVDLVRNKRSSWEEFLQRYDMAEQRRCRTEKLRRKYGWFWWLRRPYEMSRAAGHADDEPA
ncbi:MAG: hypothetical protein EXS05_14145 [Planctomycetaceae bacterium]|nr:hypothetical protein [Planctomycetaceae bacterium]